MTRMPPRTKFHSSAFIRSLAVLELADAAGPGDAFAEILGQWIHFADAIALSSVHGGAMKRPQEATTAAPVALAAERAGAELERVRDLLEHSISKSYSRSPGKSYLSLPQLETDPRSNLASAYMPYRRFYEAHQRDMEMSIRPLRFNLRAEMAKASPRLAKLAELDEAFDRILREREGKLLSKVPVLLKKRFEQLFSGHQGEHQQGPQQKSADGREAAAPAAAREEGWLARFCQDMRALLLTELELRLQPAIGLVEACNQALEQETQQ